MMNVTRSAVLVIALAGLGAASAQEGVPQLYQASYELEAARQYGPALDALARMPDAEKKTYVWQLRTGWLSYLAGQYDPAIAAYRKAVALAPDAVEPRLGLMLPLMAQRRWKDAEVAGREVLRRDPGSYLGQSRLAFALYNLGRYPEAEAMYRKVLAAYPSDVEMRAGLGWSLLKQGKREAAVAAFKDVLRVSPRQASALAGMAAAK